MYRLPFIVVFVLSLNLLYAQNKSVHGDGFKVDCKACHKADSWDVQVADIRFNHNETEFPLDGQHAYTDCKKCHESLEFKKVENDCVSCHADLHSMSVGNDCARCHSTNNWLVDYIPELHEENGFPLLGAHQMLSCVDCHQSETNLRWDRLGNDCATCHTDDYNGTMDPNHIASSFSMNCDECHDPISLDWGAGNFHFFFSLTGGHAIKDCKACHMPGDYTGLNGEDCFSCHQDKYNNANPTHTSAFGTDCARCHSTQGWTPATFDHGLAGNNCVACHQEDYNNASSVNHIALNLSTDCVSCHVTQSWKPASFPDHINYTTFEIYQGEHQGKWNECIDCHTNPNDYTQFSCIGCHSDEQDLRDEHLKEGVTDFKFISRECFLCHPKGDEK